MRLLAFGLSGAIALGTATVANAAPAAKPATHALRSPGDIDGDGLDDLVVGSAHDVRIHYTTATPHGSSVQRLAPPNRSVTSLAVGDFNGDGYADVALGDSAAGPKNHSGFAIGEVFVWYGRHSGIDPGHRSSVRGLANGDAFGTGLNVVRRNGDRYADLVVHSTSGFDTAQVLLGSKAGLRRSAMVALPTKHSAGVVSADVDGDGHPELIVGRPDTGKFVFHRETEITNFEGTLAVFAGTAHGIAAKPHLLHGKSLVGYQGLGHSLTVGHFNSDRYPDVAVSAIGSSDEATDGAVVILYGGPHGLTRAHSTLLGADLPQFGDAVSAGDVTGDGVDEVLVGGGTDFSGTSDGAVYLFFGTPSGIAMNNPQQIDADVLGNVGKQAPGYGAALAIYHRDHSGFASLAVGAPEYWSNSGAFDAGYVDFFAGSPSGADVAHGTRVYHSVQNAAVGALLAP